MPRVEIRASVASADYVYQEGETVEVTGERAAELVKRGYGVLVRGQAPETPESRSTAPETPEGAARRTRRRSSAGEQA